MKTHMHSRGSSTSGAKRLLGFGTWVLCAVMLIGAADAQTIAKDKRLLMQPSAEPRVMRAITDDAPMSSERMAELMSQRYESILRVRREIGPHPMSVKGLARRDQRLRRLMRVDGIAQPETLKVLLIRIAFREDRSGGLTSITQDGNFLLTPDPAIRFDRPPHDRQFFEGHLRGLAEYWRSMSGGLVIAETKVLPEGNQDAYFLDDIADYGPGAGGFWTVPLLERLVRDMITEADRASIADGSVSLADYDFDDPNTHIIFAHAGGDLQSNLVWQPGQSGYSPNDIPTFFVTLGDSAVVDLASTDTETGEAGRVVECSVIPESTSQDGLVGSIAAALMHEFGHALGLPDLYSTVTGLPTVGYWDIMDSGTNLTSVVGRADENGDQAYDEDGNPIVDFVTGLLPPQTSIWSKWYLGFAQEIRIGSEEKAVSLPASYRIDTREKALRIDVSPNEFFLVENRYIPPVGKAKWSLATDQNSGVVLYLGEFDDNGDLVRNTHLYDFFMPWYGGLMIWRVRQDRIENGLAFNQVQPARDELGLELIEADGIQDIGVFDFNTRGFVGSDTDAFRDLSSYNYFNGEATVTQTVDATSTEFTAESMPSSRSSFRVPTGARIEGISPFRGAAMTFTASIDGLVDRGAVGGGFPVILPDRNGQSGKPTAVRGAESSVTSFSLAGEPAIIVAAQVADESESQGLYAYRYDGSAAVAGARAAALGAPLAGPLLTLPEVRGHSAGEKLVAVGVDGQVTFYEDNSGTLIPYATAQMDSVQSTPRALDEGNLTWLVAASFERNAISSLSSDWSLPTEPFGLSSNAGPQLLATPIVSVAPDSTGTLGERVAFVTDEGLDLRSPTGVRIDNVNLPVSLPYVVPADDLARGYVVSVPGEAVQDSDMLVFIDGRGRVTSFEEDSGIWASRTWPHTLDGAPLHELLAADVDGDGSLDLVLTTATRLYAFHRSGAPLRGFPRLLSELLLIVEYEDDSIVSSPIIADIDADGGNEVVFTTKFGITHAVDSDGSPVEGFPRVLGGANTAPCILDFSTNSENYRALVLFDALGDTLGSGRRSRNARLNLYDLGFAPTVAAGTRPSEWTARGGSVSRSGRGILGDAAVTGAAPAEDLSQSMLIPNPLRAGDGDHVFVRFFSGGAHECRISVYTLEGEEVGSWTEDVTTVDAPVHVGWPATGLSSGPYLCRIDYLGADGRKTDLKTLYIER